MKFELGPKFGRYLAQGKGEPLDVGGLTLLDPSAPRAGLRKRFDRSRIVSSIGYGTIRFIPTLDTLDATAEPETDRNSEDDALAVSIKNIAARQMEEANDGRPRAIRRSRGNFL